MSDGKPWKDEETLRELYIEQGMTLSEVGDELGCTGKTIGQELKDKNIDARRPGVRTDDTPEELKDPIALQRLLFDEDLHPKEIGERVGYSRKGVQKWIKKHNIELPFPCPSCDDSFLSRQGVGQHHASSHGESLRDYESKLGDYPCSECDKAFDSDKALESHYGLIHEAGVPVTCKECGTTERYPPAIAEGRVYCKTQCMADDYASKPPEDNPAYEGGKVTDTCNICGGEYECWPFEVEQGRPTCGDSECMTASRREKVAGENNTRWIPRVEVPCTQCGTILSREQRHIEHYRPFCQDKDCLSEWLSEHSLGEDNPNYSGGAFPYGPGWNETKKEMVRERDGRVCQNPGCDRTEDEHLEEFGRKHTVHHIMKARAFTDPEERNSMSNLVTLCETDTCHKRWEKMSPLRPDTA